MPNITTNHAVNYRNTSGLFSYTYLTQVPGCRVTVGGDHLSLVLTPEKSLGPGQGSPAILLAPNLFDS